MNGHHASAWKWTDVGLAALIQSQIPGNNAAHLIAQNAGKGAAPVGPIRRVMWICNIRSALGPIHLHIGMCGRYFADEFWLADISMPSDRFGHSANFLVVQFTNGASPEVVIVVDEPNSGLKSGLLDGRAEHFADILHLDLL